MGVCETKDRINVSDNRIIGPKEYRDENRNLGKKSKNDSNNNDNKSEQNDTKITQEGLNNNNNSTKNSFEEKKSEKLSEEKKIPKFEAKQNDDNGLNDLNQIKQIFNFNISKKSIILPKYYKAILFNQQQNEISNETQWNNILKSINSLSKIQISLQILGLKERLWFEENMILSSLIPIIRDNNDSGFLKKYIKNRISLLEHFNWLCWTLSYLYLFKYENFNTFGLPQFDAIDWVNGFEWKGVYIKIIVDGKGIKNIKREIKAISMIFIEYIQIIDNCKFGSENNLLSNQLVFPLISIGEFEGKCMMCSMGLKKEKGTFKVEEDDLKKYSREDLNKSALFRNLTERNLAKIGKEEENKYLIVNAFDMIPSLFEINEEKKNDHIGVIYCETNGNKNHSIKYFSLSELLLNKDIQKEQHLSLNKEYESNFIDLKFKVINCTKKNKNEENINNFINDNFIQFSFGLIDNINKINVIPNEKQQLNKILNTKIFKAKNIIHKGNAIVMYYLKGNPIKIKYPLINSQMDYDETFTVKIKYYQYIDQFIQMLNNSDNTITDIPLLNYYFEKYGINKSLKLLILSKLSKESTITELIKVDILSNIISKYIQESFYLNYLINIYQSNKSKKEKTIIDLIYESILSILSPNSLPNETVELFYKNITKILYMFILKFNRISHSLFNTDSSYMIYKPKFLLQSLLIATRKKALLLVNQLETKFNIIINPIAKVKLSFSIGNFISYFNKNKISMNNPRINSYISGKVILFYFLAKNIKISSKYSYYDKEKEKINYNEIIKSFDVLSEISKNSNNDKVNRSVVPENFNILNTSHEVIRFHPKSRVDSLNNINIKDNSGIIEIQYDDIPETNMNDSNLNNEIKSVQNENINNIIIDHNVLKRKIWTELKSNFLFKFPSMLYKINFKNLLISQIEQNLTYEYKLFQSETILTWSLSTEMIFNDIISVNLETSYTLLYVYLCLFINYNFIESNMKKAKEFYEKMEDIFKNNIIYYDINWLIVINMLKGALNEKIEFINSEKYFSLSLIFALFNYGDPRGRNSNGNDIMMYPAWKIGRYAKLFESKPLLIESFKEFLYTIDFSQKKTLKNNSEVKRENDLFIYEDICKKCFYQKALKMKFIIKNDINNNTKRNNNNNNNDYEDGCDDDLVERPSIYISEDKINLNFNCIDEYNFKGDRILLNSTQFNFPSLNAIKSQCTNFFMNEKYIVFLIKQLSKILNKPTLYYPSEYLSYLNLSIHQEDKRQKSKRISFSKTNKYNNLSFCLNEYLFNKLDFKQNFQNNILISWGNNKHNETTHNNYNYLSLPRFVFKLKDTKITKVACGLSHNLVLTNEGNVYSWGSNMSGQCGQREIQTYKDPTEINELHGKNIRDISCGIEHSLCVTENGEVYAWGNSEDGVLGIKNKQIVRSPIKIPYFDNSKIKITNIVSGSIHNLSLDDKGKIYSWGSSKGGELGLGESSTKNADGYINEPTRISSLNHKNIKQISCGEAHSIALDSDGNVYTWGFGYNGQLGLGFCEDAFPSQGKVNSLRHTPIVLEGFDTKIKDIQCGKTFSMFISNNSELYACGVNDVNQLGFVNEGKQFFNPSSFLNSKCLHYIKPTKVEVFLNMKVIKIACGESHCIAIIKEKMNNNIKTLWSWGSNRFGQLGQGVQSKKCIPKRVDYFLEFPNGEIEDINCGDLHSLCLLKNANEDKDKEEERKIKNCILKFTEFFE